MSLKKKIEVNEVKCNNCFKLFYDEVNNKLKTAELKYLFHTCFDQEDNNNLYIWFSRLSLNKDDILIHYIGWSGKDTFRFAHVLLKYLVINNLNEALNQFNFDQFIHESYTKLTFSLKHFDNISVTKITNIDNTNLQSCETFFINNRKNDLNELLLFNADITNKHHLTDSANPINIIKNELRKMIHLDRYLKFTQSDIDLFKKDIIIKKFIKNKCFDIVSNYSNAYEIISDITFHYDSNQSLSYKLIELIQIVNKQHKKDFFNINNRTIKLKPICNDSRLFTKITTISTMYSILNNNCEPKIDRPNLNLIKKSDG